MWAGATAAMSKSHTEYTAHLSRQGRERHARAKMARFNLGSRVYKKQCCCECFASSSAQRGKQGRGQRSYSHNFFLSRGSSAQETDSAELDTRSEKCTVRTSVLLDTLPAESTYLICSLFLPGQKQNCSVNSYPTCCQHPRMIKI